MPPIPGYFLVLGAYGQIQAAGIDLGLAHELVVEEEDLVFFRTDFDLGVAQDGREGRGGGQQYHRQRDHQYLQVPQLSSSGSRGRMFARGAVLDLVHPFVHTPPS